MTAPVPYTDDLETEVPDEATLIDRTISTMRHTMAQGFEQHRHATSGTHAKSHGIVTGTLTVPSGLEPELAQGLFATPATYEIVLRYASEPGAIDPDTVRRARGAALKIMGVRGDKFTADWDAQDFLFNTWPVIPQGDVVTYLNAIEARDKRFGHQLRTAVSTMIGHPSPEETWFDRTPNIHPVAFEFYTQGAFRHGDFVGKYALFPTTSEQLALTERTVSKDDGPGVLSEWVREFYADHPARYDLRVQLLTDTGSMPVEDASLEWSTAASPYRTVATLELPPQESFSPARRVYAEDAMSWRPWNSLVAHRPLGSINRLRKRTYQERRRPASRDERPRGAQPHDAGRRPALSHAERGCRGARLAAITSAGRDPSSSASTARACPRAGRGSCRASA